LKKGLADRTSKSKSKSRAFKSKSKSSKNGLKSGLESKSGLEYYKSEYKTRILTDQTWASIASEMGIEGELYV